MIYPGHAIVNQQSPELSSTGLSVASREESVLRTDPFVVIVLIR